MLYKKERYNGIKRKNLQKLLFYQLWIYPLIEDPSKNISYAF